MSLFVFFFFCGRVGFVFFCNFIFLGLDIFRGELVYLCTGQSFNSLLMLIISLRTFFFFFDE